MGRGMAAPADSIKRANFERDTEEGDGLASRTDGMIRLARSYCRVTEMTASNEGIGYLLACAFDASAPPDRSP